MKGLAKRRGPSKARPSRMSRAASKRRPSTAKQWAEGLLLHDYLALVQALGPVRSGSSTNATDFPECSKMDSLVAGELVLHLVGQLLEQLARLDLGLLLAFDGALPTTE